MAYNKSIRDKSTHGARQSKRKPPHGVAAPKGGFFAPSGLPKPLPLGATATTAASGGNREELLGPRPAGCERQRSRRWEPQPGQWHGVSRDGEGKPDTKEPLRSDGQALCQNDTIAAQSCLAAALPSQSGLRPPAPPKGEPLAGRLTSYWTPEARYGAKGRALLTGTAASGQRTLSSCHWPRQRSTTAHETNKLCSSSVGLPDTPVAPPLGELSPKVTERANLRESP